jgi:hypothetical protein
MTIRRKRWPRLPSAEEHLQVVRLVCLREFLFLCLSQSVWRYALFGDYHMAEGQPEFQRCALQAIKMSQRGFTRAWRALDHIFCSLMHRKIIILIASYVNVRQYSKQYCYSIFTSYSSWFWVAEFQVLGSRFGFYGVMRKKCSLLRHQQVLSLSSSLRRSTKPCSCFCCRTTADDTAHPYRLPIQFGPTNSLKLRKRPSHGQKSVASLPLSGRILRHPSYRQVMDNTCDVGTAPFCGRNRTLWLQFKSNTDYLRFLHKYLPIA